MKTSWRITVIGILIIALVQSVFAQMVPQPADPPLWKGERWGEGLYEYNDAIFSTGAHLLHGIGITGKGVTAAVIDEGFYADHEIFSDKIVNTPPGTLSDHGTHVAGIVLSMAPDAQLWLEALFDTERMDETVDINGSTFTIIDKKFTISEEDQHFAAIFDRIRENARQYNIVAVNNSWGEPIEGLYATPGEIIAEWSDTNDAVQQLLQSGVAVVAAAGNNSVSDRLTFPEGLPGILSVGALSPLGYIGDFSTQHQKDGLFIVAPGQDIFSAKNVTSGTNTYEEMTGTSMASPMVTGAVALLQSGARNAAVDEIVQSLYDSADRIPFDGNAVFSKNNMPGGGAPPRSLKEIIEALPPPPGGSHPVELATYMDWLDEVASRYDTDEMTVNEWRTINRIFVTIWMTMFGEEEDKHTGTFVEYMETTGKLENLQFTEYYFLRVDKAYMDLTHKRMNMMAANIDSDLSGILRAYANELKADINQDTADIFQRLDVQDIATQTVAARRMSPRFTNATAESAHLGFIGLHRSLGRRTELNRLGQDASGSCAPCSPCDVDTNGWIEGFRTGTNKSGTLTNAAYDGHFAGTAFGVERKRGNRTLGFFGSWANHRVCGDGLAKGDWVNFGVSGRVDRQQGFLEGSFAYGYGDYDLNRYVFIPGAVLPGYPNPIVLDPLFKRAEAKTHAHDFSMRVATGRDLGKVNGWKVGPRAEMSLSHLAFGSYQERGADSLNLSVDDYKTTYLEGGAGLFVGRKIRNVVVTGKLMGMYGGAMGDDLSGRFLNYGSPYRVDAGYLSTAWVVPEASLAWNITNGVVLSGSYSGRFGKRYGENTGSVALNLYW